ncbi:hypothetical protein [Deferrisoma camini]|uniref:hypothetical protein n=1 Tax=Deferrisoma camini TaxID=1035120 RepID=UPI00046CB9F5|nr:hypothetical protein [Deferrisoma camini]
MAGKVVYVDFRKRGQPRSGFGGGPRFVFAVFLVVLLLELLVVAAWHPASIGSAFFGPTVIAVAVVVTVGVRRLTARYQVRRLYRSTLGRAAPRRGSSDRTLH